VKSLRVLLGLGTIAAIVLAAGLANKASSSYGVELTSPNAAATPGPTALPLNARPSPPIVYPRTNGPFINETRASEIAASGAAGPITRYAIGLLTYREAANWMQSWTYTIDPERAVYLVVNAGPFSPPHSRVSVTCRVYFVVVDATDGGIRAQGCKDLTPNWPQLAAGVTERP